MAKESTSSLARVALYGRVSTLHHNQDPELQMRELREYAEHRGWKIDSEYIDHVTVRRTLGLPLTV